MRTTPKISITLEASSWVELLSQMDIVQEAVKRSRIEDNPGKGIVAPTERSVHDALLKRLQWVLGEYFLSSEERAEILERMR